MGATFDCGAGFTGAGLACPGVGLLVGGLGAGVVVAVINSTDGFNSKDCEVLSCRGPLGFSCTLGGSFCVGRG